MALYLKQLSSTDSIETYEMLQRIGENENEFKNTAHGLNDVEFKKWLVQQDDWSRGQNLPAGYVAQTIYWFYDNDQIVGLGKIRHRLNDNSRNVGGNIGYAIDPVFRSKGYATKFLALLVEQTRNMGIDEILLTVERYNPASKRVIEKAGGILIKETSDRWYFKFLEEARECIM